MTVAKDAEMMINARIAQIDHLLSIQLNEIMHHPAFQKLEGSWRGLKHLMDHSETGVGLKIRVMNVTKKELLRDIEKAPEFDQSALFKKVYEEEYGVFGGAPFGALIGDYEFGKHPEDMALLEGISHIAAQAHAPFVSAAAPDLFNMESFTSLDAPRDLAKDLRQHRICQVEVIPSERRLPVCGALPAQDPWRDFPTARKPSRSMNSTTKSTLTGPTTQSISG